MRSLGSFGRLSHANTTTPVRGARLTATLVMAAMLLPSVLGAVAPAWAEGPTGPTIRFIAIYDEHANVPGDAAFEAQGAAVLYRLQSVPGAILSGPESLLGSLAADPHLQFTERDAPQEYFLQTATFSTNAADVWGSAWWPEPSQVQRKDPSPLRLPDGTAIDGRGVVVGVVDSGINALHPDLWYAPAHVDEAMPWEPKVLGCQNVPEVTPVVDQPYCDETVGHGTHVAGIVAGNGWAARNGMAPGMSTQAPPIGAAPGAQLYGFGLGAGLFIANGVEALDYVATNAVDLGIRIVTNSWGGAGACTQALPGSTVNLISNRMIDQGVVVLFANGNYDLQGNPTRSSPHAINPKPGLISVANYNDGNSGSRDGAIAGGSSDGCAGTFGPDLLWTWPDVSAPGTSITSTAAWTGSIAPPTSGGFYSTISGTSMATPHVAGIVALMLQANPELTPAQVERILIETATPYDDGTSANGIGGTTMWGSKLINNPTAGFADPGLCRVTPVHAARAEAGDTTVNAVFPKFTDLAQVTDADLFVCRDFKRGRGLVDAYAAVAKALSMRDDGGQPEVLIQSPGDGAQVEAAIVPVSGIVDRLGSGGSNQAPTAGLQADTLGGPAPLTVQFSVLGSDPDGTIASWSLDYDDGTAADTGTTVPTVRSHTFQANGDYVVALTVTDDDGATGETTLTISVGGLPVPDGTLSGNMYIYNAGGILGLSNVAALVTGDTIADPVPKYAAGEVVGGAARTVVTADPSGVPIGPSTQAEFYIFKPDGQVALGPLAAPGSVEDETLFPCAPDCYAYSTDVFQIPPTFGGRYYLGTKLTVNGQAYWVYDTSFQGLKPIDVIGAGVEPPVSAPLPLSPADLRGQPLPPEDMPVAFGSEQDPEGEDAPDDTQGDLAFMDVRKVWVGLESPTTFDVHLKVDDLGSAPPTINVATPAGPVRASVNYGVEFCLDNNVNREAASGVFCYRFSAVNSVLGPQFSGGVIQQDGSGSCGLAGLLESGVIDVANDTISYRLLKAGFNVTDNGPALADCTATPIVRGGAPITDGVVLSNLEGSTGFTAGARVVATFAQGGDSSDGNNARPYTFGQTREPLAVEAGGPYSGLLDQAIALAPSVTGGTPPYDCTWNGPGTFADPGACLTTVAFATAGAHTITLSVTDGAGATASDTATVNVGAAQGERVELLLDGDATPRASVPVSTGPTDPEEAWSSTVDLRGLEGPRSLTARWVDSDGAVLDTHTIALSIRSIGPEAFVTITSPLDDPSGASPEAGSIALEGQAGHVGAMGAPEGLNAAGFPLKSGLTLKATVREGGILAPCNLCQPSAAFANGRLGTSVTWLRPGPETQGLDGVWLDVAGFDGAGYRLDAEFGSRMDVYFFASDLDAQSAATGLNIGDTMPKTGTVPAGSNWAFAYLRQPLPEELVAAEGFDDNAILTLTPVIVPPGAPQLLTATPGPELVALNWLAPMNTGGEAVSAYKVYRDGALLDTLPGTALAFTDDGLTAGQAYSYEVSAANSAGDGVKAGPVSATPFADTTTPLAITSPADGATGVAGTAALGGTYGPRGEDAPPPGGNFANTYYFFLMNLNDDKCSNDLGHGDIFIASRLIAHARDTLGVPDGNIRFFNENGAPLCPQDDPVWYPQLPPEYRAPNNPFDGPARLSPFTASLRQAAEAAADGEAAGGAPARIFILQSSHGFYSPQAEHVFGSEMALNGETVRDRQFGDAITAALDDAEAGTTADIEAAILVDCSFCGGFGDSPLWFPGTTTTAVDSAGVVGDNRVVEVGCTWITECFGNPAVTYDHMFLRCTFTGRGDGYGPVGQDTGLPHPLPDGSGDLVDDFVLPSPTHHAKDGAITMEEAYWCALDSAKDDLSLNNPGLNSDPIPVQQMFQLVDQMDADLFQRDGFVLWDVNQNLDLGNRDRTQPLPSLNLELLRTTAPDESGDGLTPFGDFLNLDATHTATKVVVDFAVTSLAHAATATEDVVEYRLLINDNAYGICHDRANLAVYDYTGGAYMDPADAAVAYDVLGGKVHVELAIAALQDQTIPANLFAESRIANCTTAHAPQNDDRVPDVGTISTGSTVDPDPGRNEVRLALAGPGGASASGLAVLDAANDAWTFDPAGTLAEGAWTATAEHWFDDGTGMVRVEGPVTIGFTVGTPDTTPPTSPANLYVAGTTTTTASLTWDAATDNVGVTGYRLYRAGAPDVPTDPEHLVATVTGLAHTDPGLAPATLYYYRVVAIDAAGNAGAPSNEVEALTQTPPPIEESVTLTLDGATLEVLPIDTVGGPDPADWATTLDTTTIGNGFHVLVADYDDRRGSTATDEVRFYVSNGIALTIDTPANGDAVSPSFTVAGSATGAPAGAAVQVRASKGGAVVRDWAAADAFDGSAFSAALSGMPLGALTVEARLRDGTTVVASDTVQVHVYGADRIDITEANAQTVGDERLGPFWDTVPVRGTSALAPEADPRANTPPVAVITEPVMFGAMLTASAADSYDPDGTVVHWAWDLGNGARTSGAALAYNYPAAGTYLVTLTVTDNRGAVGQAQVQVTAGGSTGSVVVDAGDSRFVATGGMLTLTAQAFSGVQPIRFAWDTDEDGLFDRSGQTIQVDTDDLGIGKHTFTAGAADATGAVGTDSVPVYVYAPSTRAYHFEELNAIGLPDEQAGLSGADQGNKVYTIEVPEGSTSLDAVLEWTVYAGVIPPGTPGGIDGGPNDYDLFVSGPEGFSISSADFNMPEEVHLVSPAGGTWTFTVAPFLATPDVFTLDIGVGEAPPNPVPKANQVNEVCFESPSQTLAASAEVATGDALTGAWDTDFDGLFDDGTGMSITTNFPQDGRAHLVRFRATTEFGFRATVLLGVRPSLDCPDAPSVVVVAVSDTGINPYHRDFAGELLPDAKLRAYTTADPEVTLPDDAKVYHKLTGQLLPFTKHPSRYIPGFPEDAAPLVLTLGGGYYKALDDAEVWNKGHAKIPLGKWFWIPGTKIIAAIDTTDVAAINSDGDVYPIFDEDGHGSASASTAVGNVWGSCPRCLLVFAEGLSGDRMFFNQPWIDFVSVSGGSLGNIGGSPVVAPPEDTKAAAERGQTISYAAGNGVDLSFLTPEQTYLDESVGPDWTIRVGAVSRSTNNVVHGTGKPVDWSSFGSGTIPSACPTGYTSSCNHSGTSAATPISTGHLASILLAAREAVGDTRAGQKTPEQAGGVRQAVAVGSPVTNSPWLSDGVLQRHELWNAAFHCASLFGTSNPGFPGSLPRSQVDYVYGGYGIADAAMQACARAAITTGGAVRSTPDADQFYEADEFLRDQLWGDWDGDGDGNPGGNHNRPDSPAFPPGVTPPAGGLGPADLDTDAEVTAQWRDLMPATMAVPGYTETWYPHHKGGCDATNGGTDSLDMVDSADDNDACGITGVFANALGPAFVWPGDDGSGGFAPGAAVTGTIYLDYNHPGAPIVQAVLKAGGVEVGRSPEMQPLSTAPAFGIGPFQWTPYPLNFPTTAAVPEGASLQLELLVTGVESVFVGYEGGHTSRITITGTGGTGEVPTVGIAAPGEGAAFDKALTPSVSITGTSTDATTVQVAVDDATFATGTLAVTGTGSWSATWNLGAASVGAHTLYARACDGALCSAIASRGVVVTDSVAPPARDGSVEVQFVPSGASVQASAWVAATSYDGASGDWTFDWDTSGMANGDYDFHARLVAEGNEVGRDVFRAFLRNTRAPVLGAIGDQGVVEGNALTFGLSATDLDDDAIAFSAQGLPDGATFEDHGDGTATFTWTPRFDQQGTHEVTFEASDGGSSDTETITIAVTDARAALLGDGRGFALVQGALDAALPGETVVVLPGDHPEAVTAATAGLTLCSTTEDVQVPADVACLANAAGAILQGVTVDAAGATVQDLTLRRTGAPALQTTATAADATLTGLVLDGTGGAELRGAGHHLQGNRYTGMATALTLRGTDILATGETFAAVSTVVALDTGSQPTGNVLTRSCVDGATTLVAIASGVSGITFDARGNDWGVYTKSAVEGGINDQGTGNTVQLYPWLAEDCATPLLQPTASFTRDADPVYAVVDDIQFTDTSVVQPGSRPITTWTWTFGDGATSTAQHPRHTYAAAGTYTVTLTVTDGAELQHATSQVLQVLTWVAPSAGLAAAPNPTDRLTAVQFTDQSTPGTGTIVTRRLEFGDGDSATTGNAQHTYDALGTYTARLTVTDNKGQASSASVSIDVLNLAPFADFAFAPEAPYDIDTVQFTDGSEDLDGTVTDWQWTFGDGGSASGAAPSHAYAAPGTYTVTLTITDSDGATATATREVTVAHWFPPNADLAATPNPTDRLTAVQFTDTSTPGTGTIAARHLAFGDGADSTATTTQHTYAALGTYTAVLTVTDHRGQVGTDVVTIQVLNIPPVAAGTAEPLETDRLTPVQFTDQSTDADGAIAAWLWSFGDGATSTARNPSHTYASLGTFKVELTVTDNDGGQHTVEVGKVKVKNVRPNAQADAPPAQATRIDPVQFNDRSTDADGTIASYLWNFGDGTTSTAADPSHQYAALGTFAVTLTVTDNDGDNATLALGRIEVINLAPSVAFHVNPETPDVLMPTYFLDDSADPDGDVVEWHWSFGDTATSRDQDPMHVYLSGGFRDVTLTATDNDGASVALTQRIFVCDPAVDLVSRIDLDNIHLEFESCLRIDDLEYPPPLNGIGG